MSGPKTGGGRRNIGVAARCHRLGGQPGAALLQWKKVGIFGSQWPAKRIILCIFAIDNAQPTTAQQINYQQNNNK